MVIKRHVEVVFDGWVPVELQDYDETSIIIKQGTSTIHIPKDNAAAFAEEFLQWISTGGKESS